MKTKFVHLYDNVIILTQFILSAVIIYFVYDLLPVKYLALFCGILLFLWIVVWNLLTKENSKGKMLTRLLALLLSIVLALGNIVAYQGLDTIKKISGLDHETNLYSVVVLDNSTYQKLSDLSGAKLGIVSNLDVNNTKEAITDITSKVSISTVNYTSLANLQSSLFNGQNQAILINEAYRSFILELNSDFENNTRVIYQYQLSEDVDETDSVKVNEESFNIYISGIDTYGEVSTISRSDVNMIVTVNPKTKTILMTSIPRDYYVTLPSFNQKDKLTHAGLYGISESISALENLFGIDINYYVRVNFTSVETIVDALGGITVYNEQEFTSYTKKIYFPEGTLELDGNEALEFVRERYSFVDGDNTRIRNQQKALAAMIDQATSPSIIYHYSDVLRAISGCLQTNMSEQEIKSLITLQISNMSGWNIIQQQVAGTGSTSSVCYSMPGTALYVMEPDQNTVNQAIDQINTVME